MMVERVFSSLEEKKAFDKRKAKEISVWVCARLGGLIEITHLLEANEITHFELVRIFEIHFKTTPIQWIRKQKALLAQGMPLYEFAEDLQPDKTPEPYIPINLRKK